MRIYVTGASGFIGSALVERLARDGQDVIAVSRSPCPVFDFDNPRQQITNQLFSADWYDHTSQDSVVIHCAGLSNPRLAFASLNEINELEVRPNVDMIETLLSRGWRGRLIYLSSGGTIYGDVNQIPIPEDTPARPKTPYGLYKLHLEHNFAYLARQGQFTSVCLRISNPYGGFVRKSGQGVIPILIDCLRSGRPFQMYGDGSAQRDYIAMSDLYDAVVSAMTVSLTDQHLTVNIGSGHGVSLRQLIDMIEEYSGRRLEVVRGAAGANVNANVLDCTLAEERLGWKARTDFTAGLRALMDEAGLN